MRSSTRLGLIFFILSGVAWAQPAEVTSIRLLAERLHQAYADRNAETIADLWSDQSPQKTSQRQAVQKLFGSTPIPEIRETTVRDPEVSAGRARLRVDREVIAAPGSSTPDAGRAKLTLEWVKDQYEWKIWKETPAVEDLAARLAELSTTETPDALLAANEDLPRADVADALITRGASTRNGGDLKGALAAFTLAHKIADRAGSGLVNALALNNAGLVYYDQGDYPVALEYYRKSLALSESLHDDKGTARTLNNFSAVFSEIGELTVAAEYLDKGLAIAEKLHDNRLITNALGNIAINHARRGDYLHALALLQKCQGRLQGGTDKRAIAANLNNIGNVYLWQGDLVQSEDYFRRELEFATSAGLKPLVAVAWMGLGRVAEFNGNFHDAIAGFEKSLAVLNETGNKPFAASDLTYIGSAYSMLGEQEKAVEYFQKGLELQKAMGATSEAALAVGRIAEVYNRKGDFRKASEAAAEARQMAEAAGLREVLWLADLQAGRAAREAGEKAQAETHFRNSIATIEELRKNVGGPESEQENFFENKLEPYQRMLGLLVADGRNAEAFQYAERAKARVLLDVFHNGRAEMAALMSPEDRQRDQSLRVRLASLNTQIARARQGNATSQLSDLTAELAHARLEYDGFENELYVRHPQWKAHDSAIEPVGIDQALAMMPDAETAFLEFVQTDDQLYAFTAGKGSRELRTFTVAVSRDALTEQVRLLQRQVASHNLGFRATASALYKMLIAPAGIDLAHTRHLVVVPDGVLWELPFQVLMNPQGRYLLDDCAISYAPSLTALKAMIEVKRQRRATPAATQLLAMGDPVLGAGLQSQVKALYRDETLGQLPLAKTEVENLGQIYGEPRHVYVGAEARESRFKAEAGGARVLHLATHAVLNNASPLYSYLLLTGDPAGGSEDGLLEARELLGMNLNAELVVLSACETARGRVGAGEGVIGMSWALLVSGVPATVLSQWKVASDSTSIFMTAFHQNRKKNMGDAAALRAAALSLRKNPAYQHPFYWAAFTLIGAGLN